MILLTRGVRMTIVFKVSDNIKEEMIKYYQDRKEVKLLHMQYFKQMRLILILLFMNQVKLCFKV